MSSAPSPSTPPPPSVSTSQLRQMLDHALPTDAQLDAFCIDYLPSVHRQFSDGMERTRKLNLLLSSTPAEDILAQLRRHSVALQETEGVQPASSQGRATGIGRPGRPIGESGIRRTVALGITVGMFGLAPLWHIVRERLALRHDTRAGLGGAAPTTEPSRSPGLAPWLTSEPSEALIYASPSGRLLGQTPWTPAPAWREDSTNQTGLEVCVRSPGFVPQLVKLEPGAEPFRPRPIHVQLQRETGAALQRERDKESCHVQTPIVE